MEFENGDHLKFYDGRLIKILEKYDPTTRRTVVQFIDRDEPTYLALDISHLEINLGKSVEVMASFDSARSVHLRLNRMRGI
jgi:hypothetical protein